MDSVMILGQSIDYHTNISNKVFYLSIIHILQSMGIAVHVL